MTDTVQIESRGSLVDIVPASGPGLLLSSVRCRLRLVAKGETLDLHYQPGDARVSGLNDWQTPTVTFSEFLFHDRPPQAAPFIRRHDFVDVEFLVDGTAVGSVDRRLVAVGCQLTDAELVESEEGATRLRYTLRGGSVEGDLTDFLGLRG